MKPLSRLLVWPVVCAALASAAVGLFAVPIASHVAALIGRPFSAVSATASLSLSGGFILPVGVFALFLFVIAVAVLFRRFFTNARPIRVTDTWDCGQPITARMEYTATGFAAPIRFFFRAILLSRKALITEPVSPENPWIARRRLEWSTQSLWEEWVYKPVASAVLAIATFIKRLQSGVIQFYILLILVTLVLVLVFAV